VDARLIITGVFGLAALAWILSSKNTPTVFRTVGDTFAEIVKPLFPSQ
jgi:hypothetical protein